jgi:hypothetical protein
MSRRLSVLSTIARAVTMALVTIAVVALLATWGGRANDSSSSVGDDPTAAASAANTTLRGDPSDTTRLDDPPATTVLEGIGITVGEVDVWVEPIQVTDEGAAFAVEFDTHTVDLGFDVAGLATLEIDGVVWIAGAWDGDPPGGHHRAGTLTFEASGPTTGRMTLRLGGLPEPTVLEWELGS